MAEEAMKQLGSTDTAQPELCEASDHPNHLQDHLDHLGQPPQAGQALGTGQEQSNAETDGHRGQPDGNRQEKRSWANWILETNQRSAELERQHEEKRRNVRS